MIPWVIGFLGAISALAAWRLQRGLATVALRPDHDGLGAGLLSFGLLALTALIAVPWVIAALLAGGGADLGRAHANHAVLLVASAVILVAIRRAWPGSDPLGLRPRTGRFRCLGFGAACWGAAIGPVLAVQWAQERWILGPEEAGALQRSLRQFLGAPAANRALLVAGIVLAVPLAEELIWRGCLQPAFRAALAGSVAPRAAQVLAVVGSAAGFTLLHERLAWLPVFVLGLALGSVYERSRSLWSVLAFHALHNAATLALATFR